MWLHLCNQHSKLLFSNNVTQGSYPAQHVVLVGALDLLEDVLRKQECSKAHIMLLLEKASSDIPQRYPFPSAVAYLAADGQCLLEVVQRLGLLAQDIERIPQIYENSGFLITLWLPVCLVQ